MKKTLRKYLAGTVLALAMSGCGIQGNYVNRCFVDADFAKGYDVCLRESENYAESRIGELKSNEDARGGFKEVIHIIDSDKDGQPDVMRFYNVERGSELESIANPLDIREILAEARSRF